MTRTEIKKLARRALTIRDKNIEAFGFIDRKRIELTVIEDAIAQANEAGYLKGKHDAVERILKDEQEQKDAFEDLLPESAKPHHMKGADDESS